MATGAAAEEEEDDEEDDEDEEDGVGFLPESKGWEGNLGGSRGCLTGGGSC